jgi:hypothetical protein
MYSKLEFQSDGVFAIGILFFKEECLTGYLEKRVGECWNLRPSEKGSLTVMV